MMITLAKVRSVSCKRCSVVSASNRPSIIWSRMFLLVQPLEQKLHVFTSSRRDTRKSSNASPTCCIRLRKFLRSTVSLTCPSTYRLMARMIDSTLLFSSSVNPRFRTIDNVSREKHNISACTCFCASSPAIGLTGWCTSPTVAVASTLQNQYLGPLVGPISGDLLDERRKAC